LVQGRSVKGGCTNPNRNRLGGDLLDDADSREQVSLKGALHLLAELGKTGTLVFDGRKSCAKRLMWITSCTRRWVYFSSK
jgi:hypothetical protein